MARRAKASEPSKPERESNEEIIKVDEPFPSDNALPEPEMDSKPKALPMPNRAPVDIPPAPPASPRLDGTSRAPSGPSFGQRVAGFFSFLFRLVILLIALALISVALYYVIPWLYQSFVRPVEQNTAQVSELQSWQQQTVQDLSDLQTKLQTVESVQNEHDRSLTELDQRLTVIEKEINARTQSLAALERMQTELQTQAEADSAELQRQIGLLKAMELLSRARLFMYQSNFGLAEQDVQLARELLATLRPDASRSLAADLDAVILRLDLTLSNLPEFPVAASDDLDIAWQILLSGRPPATPTPAVTLSPTSGATDLTVTSTPAGTLQPTATS